MLASMPAGARPAVGPGEPGRAGLASMRAFQDTASELALLRRRMHHHAADAHAVEQERELLHALTARRAEFVGLPVT